MKSLARRLVLRVAEWGRVRVLLTATQKSALQAAAQAWQREHGFAAAPLWFEGAQGEYLRTRHYVGLIEAGGVAVEIYPKIDTALWQENISDTTQQTVLRNLLWLLEAAGHSNVYTGGIATLREAPLSFFDLFALLFAQRLLPELSNGVPRAYVELNDDLRAVRERIDFSRQLTRHWDRRDVIACRYAEFLADTPQARLLKCACRMLTLRVRHPQLLSLLDDCLTLLSEATDVAPREALSPRFQPQERFAESCDFARLLLQGMAFTPQAGSVPAMTFLIDMNLLFEAYVRAALRARFAVPVAAQVELGALLRAPRAAIKQRADFRWKVNGQSWLGDAKYKFEAPNTMPRPAAEDVRQITVYAEMARRNDEKKFPHLALFYPLVGEDIAGPLRLTAWNEATLFAVPVRLLPMRDGRLNIRAALPPGFG